MAPRRFGSFPGLSLDEALRAEDEKQAARGEAFRHRAQNDSSAGEADSALASKAPHPMSILGSTQVRDNRGQLMDGAGRTVKEVVPYPRKVISTSSPFQVMSPMSSLRPPASPGSFVFGSVPSSTDVVSSMLTSVSSSSSAVVVRPLPVAPVSLSAAMQNKTKQRKDIPEVYDKIRGSKRMGLEIARDPERLKTAIARYEKDEKSSGDTSEFNVRTWQEFHHGVDWSTFGLSVNEEVFPLTPMKIKVVGSILKESGYRSTGNETAV